MAHDFKIGHKVYAPSGMGGVWAAKITEINGDQITMKIDNKQYPDAHGQLISNNAADIKHR